MMQRKFNKLNAYIFILFYATTVNISMGFYTPQIYSHGALGFMMHQINIFIFSFYNAMLRQKSKYAKK
jgi:hypothetical protein